ncbi:6,7-dimethyl-8-ribityllumazine synthase [Alloprevotella sp. oral taxon 473 str. F0040]|jgi:6,7-dimethyl-8-ribityllumazine synthase|nr:6,7-dimethyl-8-ribityllumazine synthase [Alloprevotella sp. oral taxon 473]EKX88455.1 6,7-dimethyl-8-ribityllumazine synthase [Alloprevotella sp. oral taxon 473 str. F0040]
MSSFNFLQHNAANIPDASMMRFGIVVTEWNAHITEAMLKSVIATLTEHGASETSISVRYVPGAFELVYGCAQLAEHGYVDAIIALGCVIKGDTPHFDYICQGTTAGLVQLNAAGKIPMINGVLTVNNDQQAEERAGAQMDKGREFAITAIKMVDFMKSFE